MQHFTHTRLVRRNHLLGRVLSFGGLGIIVAALIVSLTQPTLLTVILPVSLIGMVASQFGSLLLSRWNRKDRADLMLEEALKGLDARYAGFHYLLGAQHALLGPSGAWALVPRSEVGQIEFEGDRWWITPARRGRPQGKRRELTGVAEEAEAAARSLRRRLDRALPDHTEWNVGAIVVFLADGARVQAEGASPPAAHVKKLKELIRRLPRRPGPTEAEVAKLAAAFRSSTKT